MCLINILTRLVSISTVEKINNVLLMELDTSRKTDGHLLYIYVCGMCIVDVCKCMYLHLSSTYLLLLVVYREIFVNISRNECFLPVRHS